MAGRARESGTQGEGGREVGALPQWWAGLNCGAGWDGRRAGSSVGRLQGPVQCCPLGMTRSDAAEGAISTLAGQPVQHSP